jgi:hypothetical protein
MSVKISELNAVETLEIEDVVPIVNVSSGVTEKATIAQIVAFAAGDGNALLIQGVPVSATPPIHGEVIVFDEDAGEWGPGTGIPVPNAPGDVFISDDGLTGTWRPLTEDDIGDGFVVTMAGTQTVEIGATVATPNFTAVYTGGAATAATLTDNDGSAPKVLTLPATSFESDEDFTKTANNASVTFTITAAKGAVVDTSSVTITWLPLVYYGVEVPAAYTEAFIEALAERARCERCALVRRKRRADRACLLRGPELVRHTGLQGRRIRDGDRHGCDRQRYEHPWRNAELRPLGINVSGPWLDNRSGDLTWRTLASPERSPLWVPARSRRTGILSPKAATAPSRTPRHATRSQPSTARRACSSTRKTATRDTSSAPG